MRIGVESRPKQPGLDFYHLGVVGLFLLECNLFELADGALGQALNFEGSVLNHDAVGDLRADEGGGEYFSDSGNLVGPVGVAAVDAQIGHGGAEPVEQECGVHGEAELKHREQKRQPHCARGLPPRRPSPAHARPARHRNGIVTVATQQPILAIHARRLRLFRVGVVSHRASGNGKHHTVQTVTFDSINLCQLLPSPPQQHLLLQSLKFPHSHRTPTNSPMPVHPCT